MTRKGEERLIRTLELIDNDLETLALAFLAVVPPLIHMAFASMPNDRVGIDAYGGSQQAEVLSEILSGLAEAHGERALAIRTQLTETLKHV